MTPDLWAEFGVLLFALYFLIGYFRYGIYR